MIKDLKGPPETLETQALSSMLSQHNQHGEI